MYVSLRVLIRRQRTGDTPSSHHPLPLDPLLGGVNPWLLNRKYKKFRKYCPPRRTNKCIQLGEATIVTRVGDVVKH